MTASTELVPVANLAEIEALDPAHREIAVTNMLSEARSWLAHAVESTAPREIADFRAMVATIAGATQQLNLSKEIQADAAEMVRRAERGVGQAVRRGQKEGAIAKPGDIGGLASVGVRGALPGSRRSPRDDLESPNGFFSHESERSDAYAMTDGVTDEQFDEAITDARTEGNLSRANVVRKVKAKVPPPPPPPPPPSSDRPEILRGTRRINPDRVIGSIVTEADAITSTTSLLDQVDFSQLDRTKLAEWISSLSESIRGLRSLKTALERELTHD